MQYLLSVIHDFDELAPDEAPDDETALRLATEGSKACNRKWRCGRCL